MLTHSATPASNMPLVSAVVVNYNADEETRDCLRLLRQTDYRKLRVYLINNGRTGVTSETAHATFGDAEVLHAPNRGFAAACNLGIQRALREGTDYVWLVNNDLAVTPTTLSDLLGVAESAENLACCGPKIVYRDRADTIQFAGGFARKDASFWFPRGDWERDVGQYDHTEQTDWISGACMLVARPALRDIGLLDESYFLYYEDVDWCVRARKRHWRCLYVGTSVVVHKGGLSTHPVRAYYYPRAHLVFLSRHYPYQAFPALRRFYSHNVRAHVRARDWVGLTTDLRVCVGFLRQLPTIVLRQMRGQ
ncbi:MAG: glycosyltransferase family 2 protein [Chloroflexota bacterium]|nr:MAG: glycosyltransferase family 2 protein [Chloroflexota bacterium]